MMRNSFAIIDFIIFEVSTNILSFRFDCVNLALFQPTILSLTHNLALFY
jgi:hypothetical protein